MSEEEKKKMIEYLQNHDYKVFTNEAYNTFVSQSKSVKKEIYPSPPSFYASPALPKLSYINQCLCNQGQPTFQNCPYSQVTLVGVMYLMMYGNMRLNV